MTGCWKEKKKKDIGYEAIQKKLLNKKAHKIWKYTNKHFFKKPL